MNDNSTNAKILKTARPNVVIFKNWGLNIERKHGGTLISKPVLPKTRRKVRRFFPYCVIRKRHVIDGPRQKSVDVGSEAPSSPSSEPHILTSCVAVPQLKSQTEALP